MTPERSVSRPWTVQEDELLIRAVADHGENDNWKEVAMCIPGRTNEACRKRWLDSLALDVKKTAWTPEEDRLLLELYVLHAGKWAAIAKQIPGRTDDACSKRYREALDLQLKMGEWTAEEDAQLLQAYQQLDGRWGLVGQQLQRSGLGCRNRWRLLERKRSTSQKQNLSPDFTTEQPPPQPLPQQPSINWENDTHIPVVALSQYASSSSSTALADPVTQQYSNYASSMSSGSTSTYVNLPSTSTSPVSHPIEFATTAMYTESVDQLQRHTSVSVSDDCYIMAPAGHEDRRMSYHDRHSFPFQYPDSSDYTPRDQPRETTVGLHQPRVQYNDELLPDQLFLFSRPPTSTQDSLQYAQQQSDHLVRCTSPSTPQQDPQGSTKEPSTSRQHNSLVHRSIPSFKSSLNSPYPKQPEQLDTSPPTQDEPNVSVGHAKQRVRPAAPRKRPDSQAPFRLSSDLPATPDPSIKPYACGHESCWPATASTSHACYSTSRGLSDHIKAEHPDDVGGDRPYRCGLEGCGKSWKSINGLQYHLQISKAHFQHAITNTYLVPYIDGLSVPSSVEASMSTETETRKKQYTCPHENCPNRYKQLSGLRYHLAHGHPADLPAQLDFVPPALSQEIKKMKMQARVENGPSEDDRSFLQQRDVTAHPGTLELEVAKTMVNPSREHPHSCSPDPIGPLAKLARFASEYCLNLNGLVSLDNCYLLRNRYAAVRSGDLHQKDSLEGIGGDSSGAKQSTRVAIKTLRGKPPGDLDDIKRFLGEVHVWSKLHHQNILAPLGLTTEFEQTVSVVSLWRGNARDYVQDKTVDPRPLIEGIAQGMYYLHNHQPTAILHGHLNGATVVISDDGQVLLTDFGFSDIVVSTFSMTDVSHRGREDVINWMSPEMFNLGSVSVEGDVWAFGMTALELFTRQDPFHRHGLDTLSVTIAQGHLPKRPSVEDACSRMTDMWWDMCSRCWRCDPSSRPTMAHIVQEIGTILSPVSSALDHFTNLALPYTVEPIERDGTTSTSGSETVGGRMANGIKVAVKTLCCSPLGDTHDIKRVLDDISTWCKLHHDNILPVLGITTKFDNAVSVVSLWMESGNAHDYVRNNDVSPVPLLVGVASGLRYLHGHHSHPIYHGNLRGHNVLISQSGQALLTDFGLSELLGSSFNPRLVNWTPPEHLDDFKGSPEGDVWAFGMTALELFTRSFPFHDIQDVKQRIVKGPPERPSDCSRLTDKWWEIFSSCWERDPRLRPSIGEMTRRVAQEHFVGLWLRGSPDVWRLFQNMF